MQSVVLDAVRQVNHFVGADDFFMRIIGRAAAFCKLALQGCTLLPAVEQGFPADVPLADVAGGLALAVDRSVVMPDAPVSARRGRKGVSTDWIYPLAAIHGVQRHHIAPRQAVVAHLQRTHIG